MIYKLYICTRRLKAISVYVYLLVYKRLIKKAVLNLRTNNDYELPNSFV